MMTRVPLGSNSQGGRPLPKIYRNYYEFASQFQGAEMIAKEYGITREDTDRFGLLSQRNAQAAWREGRYAREVVPVEAPVLGEDGKPTGERKTVARDEGLRETSLEKLAALNAVEPGGVHTAARRHRCPTAPRQSCLASPGRRRRSVSARAPASSRRRSSASIR
jgi:acetyl-CoA C-acetyltransferase